MKIIHWLSGFIAVLLFACSDSSDPGISYFEVAVEDGYINAGDEAWVFIHNGNGEVLDAKVISNGNVTRFQSPAPESKISITIANVYAAEGMHSPVCGLKSYLGVNTPAQWIFKKNETITVNCGDTKGTVNISINDAGVGEVYASCLSTPGSFDWPDYNLSSSTSLVFRPIEVKKSCDDLFLYMMGKDQQPRYKLLDDIVPGTYNFTLNDLSAFDQVIETSFPKPTWSNLIVKAVGASQSVYDPGTYINYDTKSVFETDLPVVRAGYLNKYTRYVTDLDVFYMNSHRFEYSEAPGIPASIDLPLNFNPVVTDKNFITYQYTTNQKVAFRESLFVYFSVVQSEYFIEWSVFADGESSFKHPAVIPDSFLIKYPGLHVEKTAHNFTRFYTQYKSLNELVGELYQDVPPPEAFKYVSKSVYH
jgi:hypothetical protein